MQSLSEEIAAEEQLARTARFYTANLGHDRLELLRRGPIETLPMKEGVPYEATWG